MTSSKSNSCLLCNSEQLRFITRTLRDTQSNSVYQCKKCGLYQLQPIPSDDEIFSFYHSLRHSIPKTEKGELRWKELVSLNDTKRRAYFVSQLKERGYLLDYGFGYGFFLKEMVERGYLVTGVELSQIRINSAKDKLPNIPLHNSLENIQDNSQDIITLFHVLEHVTNPVGLLKRLAKKLKKEGLIIVEVPNVEDRLMQWNKPYYDFYWKKAHLSYFSSNTLKKCLEQAGLSTLSHDA